MKYYKTLLPNIVYAKTYPNEWRFFNLENGRYSCVGEIYPSKEMLLIDMKDYLARAWDYKE